MRRCLYCAEQIPDDTILCPFCRSDVRIPPGPPQAPPAVPEAPAEQPLVGEGALRFSHSGSRYLLGFGPDSFAIWDRQQPGGPVSRFPRTDEGWREAWLAFVRLEPHPAEISLPGAPLPQLPVRPVANRGARSDRPVSGAWWLLPILFGTLGGLVAWAVTRRRDRRTARNMLAVGVALSLLLLLVYVATGQR